MAAFSNQVVVAARWLSGAVYVCAGLVLLVLGLPLAALPFNWEGFARWVPWCLMALPVWLGIASAPGCLLALTLVIRQKPANVKWVRFSLWGGLIAATAGTAGGALMALFIPFGLVGMIGSIVLLFATDEVRGRPQSLVRRWWATISATVVVVFVVTLWALQAKPLG
jgi:hypothetical protein